MQPKQAAGTIRTISLINSVLICFSIRLFYDFPPLKENYRNFCKEQKKKHPGDEAKIGLKP